MIKNETARLIKSRQDFYWYVGLIILAPLPLFRLLLNPDRILFARDIGRSYLPAKHVWLENILHFRQIPYWDYLNFSGTPFWADCNQGPLNPFNIIFLIFSENHFYYAYSWFVAAHFSFLFCGLYFYARKISVRPALAGVSTISFGWSGIFISCISTVNILGSISCVPWFIGLLLDHEERPKPLNYFYLSLALAGPIFFGDPQVTFLMALILIFWRFDIFKSPRKHLRILLPISCLALLVSAIQLLPTLELVLHSSRALGGITELNSQDFSLHPMRILEFLFPNIFGSYVPENNYTGFAYVNGFSNQPFLFYYYLGTVSLAGVLLFLSAERKKINRNLLVFFLLSLFMALGIHSPVYGILYKYFPFWKFFRYPERLTFWPLFILFHFGVLGWQKAVQFPQKMVFLILLMAGLAIVALNFLLPNEAFSAVFPIWICLSLLLLLHNRGKLRSSILFLLLGTIAIIDSGNVAQKNIWDQPSWLAVDNPLAQEIKSKTAQLLPLDARRYNHGRARKLFFDELESLPLNTVGKSIYIDTNVLLNNYHALYNIPATAGYATFEPMEYANFCKNLLRSDWRKLFTLLGIRFYAERKLEKEVHLIELPEALPLVFSPQKVTFLNSQESIVNYINSANFDPQKELLLESTDVNFSTAIAPGKPKMSLVQQTDRLLQLKIENLSHGQFLHWSQRFDSHWHPYVNGNHLVSFKANGWGMATYLPSNLSGTIILNWEYEDFWIELGKLLFVCWVTLFGIYLLPAFPNLRLSQIFPRKIH